MLRALTAVALFAGTAACNQGHPSSHFEKLQVDQQLQPFALAAEVANDSAAHLGWQAPPTDCAHAFKLAISYEPGLKFEESTESGLILARNRRRAPYRKRTGDGTKGVETQLDPGPIPADVIVPGELFYRGIRAERVGATRDFFASGEFFGPASPMAGCFWRTWDPMEDALALGWPKLPNRLTAIGEQWAGLRVDAQCARAACVDPKTGGGGPDNHFRACATGPFRETLAGLYEIGGERFAWVKTEWDDGSGGEGISSERHTLLNVAHGRPVWSKSVVDHRFAQPTVNGRMEPIVRTWEMTAIDSCPGSLASVGWSPPAEASEMLAMLQDGLSNLDELRKSRPKKGERDQAPAE